MLKTLGSRVRTSVWPKFIVCLFVCLFAEGKIKGFRGICALRVPFSSINNVLDFCLKLKGEERKVKNRFVEHNLKLHAHNGSGFDFWIVLNNLSCDKHIVVVIENGKGIIELKVFNGYIGNKEIPQNLHFSCGMIHLNY